MNYYVVLLLPIIIPLGIFILLVRKGYKKRILITSVVLGLLNSFVTTYQGGTLWYALINGIISFLIFYILFDVIYRLISWFQKPKNTLPHPGGGEGKINPSKRLIVAACIIVALSAGGLIYGQIQEMNYQQYANSKETLNRANDFAKVLGYYNFNNFLLNDEVMKEFDLSDYTTYDKMKAVAELYGYRNFEELEDVVYQENGKINYYRLEKEYGYPKRK